MSAITDQQIADAQAYPQVNLTLWDPELSWGSQRDPGDTLDNQGCPPGYFTIYLPTAAGTFGAGYGRACRLMATSTAQTIQQETAPPMVDQATINLANALGQIKTALTPSIPTWVWVLGGLLAVTFFFPYRTGRAVRQVYEGARSRNPLPLWAIHAGRHAAYRQLTKGNRRKNPRMTFKEAQRELRELGISLTRSYGDEYRVNYRRGSESTAYYTNDLQDAHDTGMDMAHRGTPGVSYP